MDYSTRIHNIQITPGIGSFNDDFPQGHKEARHAAAEIAMEADAEIERLVSINNQCRLAFAGLVSVSSAVDMLDDQ